MIAPKPHAQSNWQSWLAVAVLIYLLLAAVGAIGDGFKLATSSNAKQLFSFASNPFVALIVGIVATALIQSSSTVTSIIVGMVAGVLLPEFIRNRGSSIEEAMARLAKHGQAD